MGASRIVGRKFTVFALFYFVFEGNSQVKPPPPGRYIWRGDLTEGFLRYEFEGLIIGEAYFRNFTVYERAGILLVDVYESVGKFFISVCKMPQSAYRCVSWL